MTEAKDQCEHLWMLKALEKCVDYLSSRGFPNSSSESSSDSFSQLSDEEQSQECTEYSECEEFSSCVDSVTHEERPSSLREEIPIF